MAKIKPIFEVLTEYTPEGVTAIRVGKARVSQFVLPSSSGKHPSGAAAKLLQLIDKKGLGWTLPRCITNPPWPLLGRPACLPNESH